MTFVVGDIVMLKNEKTLRKEDNLLSLKVYLGLCDITLNELKGKKAKIILIDPNQDYQDVDDIEIEIFVMFLHDEDNKLFCFITNELILANQTESFISIYDELREMLNTNA